MFKQSKKNMPKTKKSPESTVSTKSLDIVILSVLILIYFLLPVFFTGLVAQGIGFEKMIVFYFLVLLGLVAWVTKGVIAGELRLKRTPLDLPILVIVVVYFVSTLLSVNTNDSIFGAYGSSAKGFAALLVFVVFYYLMVNNLNAKRIKLIFASFLFSSSLLIIYSLLQIKGIFVLSLPFTKNNSFNPLGSLSALTMFGATVLPILVVATAQFKKIYDKLPRMLTLFFKIILGLVVVADLVLLFLLNGFTFWPVPVVGAVIVLMFLLAKIVPIANNNLLIPLGVFLALIILLVLGNFNVGLNLPAEVSLSRSASWKIAKEAFKQNPVFGSGPATYYYDFSRFKELNFNASPLWNVRFDSAAGALFELLSTVGILGVLAITVLVLIVLSLIFLSIIKNKDSGANSLLLGSFAAFFSLLVFSLLFSQNNSLIINNILISVLVIVAAIIFYPEQFKELKLSFRASPKYALALAAMFLTVSAGVVVLFTIGLKMYLADMYAKEALGENKIKNKIEKLEKAIGLAPFQDVYYLSLANNYMALANQDALGGKDQADIAQKLGKAIEQGKKAVEIAPTKAADNESLALIYENASFYTRGALEWSEKLYEKQIELEPNNPTPHLRLALVNMAKANAETDKEEKNYYINEAIEKYDEAIKLKQNLAAAHYGKAIAYEKLNDLDNAIDNLKKANLYANGNVDYRFELGRLFFNRGVSKQPNLSQTATQKIAEKDISPENASTTNEEEVSITSSNQENVGGVIKRNVDINSAEQLFIGVLNSNPNHANALYSLAVLYQKIGEPKNAKQMVDLLLRVVRDERTKQAIRQQFASLL